MSRILVLIIILIIQGCGDSQEPCGDERRYYEINNVTICPVSMINLIATPEKYDGKVVSVTGFYARGFELSGLFFHKDDLLIRNRFNALWVNTSSDDSLRNWVPEKGSANEEWLDDLVSEKDASGNYVSVIGVFRAGVAGHLGAFSGELELMVDLELVK
jgi:hypothetical protein